MKRTIRRKRVKRNVSIRTLVKYVFLLGFGVFILYACSYIYKLSTYKISLNSKYKFDYMSNFSGDSLLIVVFNGEGISTAGIEEICLLVNNDRLEKLCMNGDIILENRSEYKVTDYVRVTDLMISSGLYDNSDLQVFIKQLEAIWALSLKNVIFIPRNSINAVSNSQNVEDLLSYFQKQNDFKLLLDRENLVEFFGECYGNMETNELNRWMKIIETKEVNETLVEIDSTTKLGGSEEIVSYVSYDFWDTFFPGIMSNKSILSEQAQIEIYNATNINGYASFFARWLKNNGLQVVRTENAPYDGNACERTIVYVPANAENINDSLELVESVIYFIADGNYQVEFKSPEFMYTGDIIIILCN